LELNKNPRKISGMFDEIAGSYDFLNHLFTLNIDKIWRRKLVDCLISSGIKTEVIIDLASGTGDLTKELLRLNPLKIYSCDISQGMLDVQKRKISSPVLETVLAGSELLPREKESVDIVTIGFGIRNFDNPGKSLGEINRVLKKNGMLIVLEMFGNSVKSPFFNFYFGKIVPKIGKIVSGSAYAYDYLYNSVKEFKNLSEFTDLCSVSGFEHVNSVNNFRKFVYTVYYRKI
jgi:demethylmenaquinone methyltransferase/2-methoxy-6-polyprenyl-1,4-benzoquinol methylase